MLLILAHQIDDAVDRAIAGWPGADVAVLRPSDFSAPGWIVASSPSESVFVCAGQRIPASRVQGGINLVTAVAPEELYVIESEDREYIAHELSALLTHVLASLPVPVVNRPRGASLQGVSWSLDAWALACAACGGPAFAPGGDVPGGERMEGAIWFLGEVISATSDDAGRLTAAVARRAGVDHLELGVAITTTATTVRHVRLAPDLGNTRVRAAIARTFGVGA